MKPARAAAAKKAAKRWRKPAEPASARKRAAGKRQELRHVRLHIAWIGRTRSAPIQSLTAEYLKRLSRFAA